MRATTAGARRYLTTAEVADLLRVGEGTVRRWTEEEKLPRPVRVGRKLLYSASQIDKILERSV